jgi:glutamyl/glutaminyl-tRNA synthetase
VPGVALVIRGEDLLASTGRQIHLGRMLGRPEPPVFLHHPLLRKPSGDKLSKASHDTGTRELRADGGNASAVLGEAAFRPALIATSSPVRADSLSQLFT